MLTAIFLLACVIFILAYVKYGAFLKKHFELDNKNLVPSQTMYDGVDYVPAPMPVLFGHHFAAISGAGPLIGPVLAAQFGFLPGFLWLLFGAWSLSLEYMAYPLESQGIRFPQQRELAGARRMETLGFGIAVLLGLSIPVLNILIPPAAVVGATLYVAGRNKPSRF